MNHVQGTQSACFHRDSTFIRRRLSSLRPGMRGGGRSPALCLISLCLVLLLGLPARSQSTADDRLGPGDSIELHVWHWTVLRGGILEGLQLNRNFSIDPTGKVDLPNIGSVDAAGLRPDELAKLIADRLQARSGLPERPETTVERILKPAMETTDSVASTGDQSAPEPSAVAEANGNPSPVPSQSPDIATEPGTASPGGFEPPAEPAPMVPEAPKPPEPPKEAAQALPGEQEQALRRELAAARSELDVMQRNARDRSAEAHAVADKAAKQAQDLEKQRQKAKTLALDLEAARRVIEGFKAKAIVWDNEKAAMLEADRSAEASQVAVQRALDEERHRVELLEQELAASRQAIDALKTGANLAAAGRANAIKDRQVAEAALKQAGEALALERQRADAAARDLDSVRMERDASRDTAAALSAALEQERERSIGLARSLSAARQAMSIVKPDAGRRVVGVKRRAKAPVPASSHARMSERPLSEHSAPARKPPDKQRVKVQKPPQPDLEVTIALPAPLLPTRPLEPDPRW